MVVGIDKSIVVQNGKYILMPPAKADQEGWGNNAHPNVFEAGGDSAKLYPVHTKFVDFDREFIYGFMESVSVAGKANLGMFNTNKQETVTMGSSAKSVGDTILSILASTLDDETTAAAKFTGCLTGTDNSTNAWRFYYHIHMVTALCSSIVGSIGHYPVGTVWISPRHEHPTSKDIGSSSSLIVQCTC